MKKRTLLFICAVFLTSAISACASDASIQISTSHSTIRLSMPGPNLLLNQPDAQGRVACAVAGLWHGLISPVTLVVSFFNSDVQMFEGRNAGSEYNFGFFLGQAVMLSVLGLFLRIRRTAWK